MSTTEKKRTLFDITDDMRALDDLLFECGGDISDAEAEKVVDAWFAELSENFETKVDNYAALIRTMECRATARLAEIDRLDKLFKADQRAAQSLKARLMIALQQRNLKKVETPRFRVSVAGNGGKQPIDVDPQVDVDQVYEETPALVRVIPEQRVIDKDAVRYALEFGSPLTWACLRERGTHLSIR